MKTLWLPLLLLPALCSATEVFRWTDEKGNIHFGDQPGNAGAQSVELREPTVIGAPAYDQLTPASSENPIEALISYQVSLTSPQAEETFHDAQGIIPVQAQVQPEPEPAARLQYRFLLDGQVVAEGAQSSIQLTGIDRGAHQVQVVLVDPDGVQQATSAPVTFYLHKPTAKLQKQPKKP